MLTKSNQSKSYLNDLLSLYQKDDFLAFQNFLFSVSLRKKEKENLVTFIINDEKSQRDNSVEYLKCFSVIQNFSLKNKLVLVSMIYSLDKVNPNTSKELFNLNKENFENANFFNTCFSVKLKENGCHTFDDAGSKYIDLHDLESDSSKEYYTPVYILIQKYKLNTFSKIKEELINNEEFLDAIIKYSDIQFAIELLYHTIDKDNNSLLIDKLKTIQKNENNDSQISDFFISKSIIFNAYRNKDDSYCKQDFTNYIISDVYRFNNVSQLKPLINKCIFYNNFTVLNELIGNQSILYKKEDPGYADICKLLQNKFKLMSVNAYSNNEPIKKDCKKFFTDSFNLLFLNNPEVFYKHITEDKNIGNFLQLCNIIDSQQLSSAIQKILITDGLTKQEGPLVISKRKRI